MNEMRRGKREAKLARTPLQGLKHRAEQGRQRTPGISCPEKQKRQPRGRGQGGVSAPFTGAEDREHDGGQDEGGAERRTHPAISRWSGSHDVPYPL